MAPATPPTTAPIGPATIPPTVAPTIPPAVCLETVGKFALISLDADIRERFATGARDLGLFFSVNRVAERFGAVDFLGDVRFVAMSLLLFLEEVCTFTKSRDFAFSAARTEPEGLPVTR